jgi:exodeoxyribonuclease V alpha subunit
LETLSGSIERITYYNPENGYTVARLRPDRRRASIPAHGVNREGLLTIVGNLPELTPGEYLKLKGDYANHPKHGFQFQVEICEQSLPATIDGIRRYLGSGLVKGIGPKMADRIVEEFGEETLSVIEEQPERLRDVPDIGPKAPEWAPVQGTPFVRGHAPERCGDVPAVRRSGLPRDSPGAVAGVPGAQRILQRSRN